MVDEILPDEVATFLKTYPDTEVIDLLIPDMNGVLRGKQIPIHALSSVFEIGLPFAGASNLMNIKGEVANTIIQGGQDGDPDVLARPVPGSLAPVPWALRPTGQLLMGGLWVIHCVACTILKVALAPGGTSGVSLAALIRTYARGVLGLHPRIFTLLVGAACLRIWVDGALVPGRWLGALAGRDR